MLKKLIESTRAARILLPEDLSPMYLDFRAGKFSVDVFKEIVNANRRIEVHNHRSYRPIL